MAHEVETRWTGKMEFQAEVGGHKVIMDAPERAGGEDHGPIPKPFMLTALTGCTGMDVVALLRKRGKTLAGFSLHASGELGRGMPIEYASIHLLYAMEGDESDREAALEAVTLSQEKYCGVSHMLKKIIPVTWEVRYNGALAFTNRETQAHTTA
jgi:putative redox protein